MPQTSHAMITPIQRRRHAARRYWEIRTRSESMTRCSSEPGLRDDQRIAGAHLDVLADVAVLDQIAQPHLDGLLLAVAVDANDHRAVAGGILRQTLGCDH